jgi:thiol-disulfide isomerase/thioredoxin
MILLWMPSQLGAGEVQPYEGFLQSPQLSLADLGGKNHRLSDYRGQVVLVNFWASWCAPCILEMPDMQRLKEKLSGRPFTILAVNVRESPGTIWKFLSRVKVDFTLLRDSDGLATRDWEVHGYPTSFLVDARGEIRYIARGARKWDAPDIVQIIEDMLDGDSTP